MTGESRSAPGAGGVAERLTWAVDRLGQAVRTMRADAAYRLGVSPAQAAIVERLAAAPEGRRTVGALATELDLTPATVSDAVAALRRKSLVETSAVAGSRRLLALTAQGRALVDALAAAHEPLRSAVRSLPAADQRATLAAALRLIAGLQREGVVTVSRMCTTCRFFDDLAPTPRCSLLQVALVPEALRVDCPEHEPAA